jgi:predicted ATPase/DNA-binding SARP family transcriptional activator/Tfp pilus assembly protein PilF
MQPRLRLLGSPQLETDGVHLDLSMDRPVSLAFYLLLRGDWVQRSELVYLYYPDAEESHAQSNFRKLIHRLKQHPWAASLEAEATRLRLVLPTDVAEYRRAIAQKDFAQALALHRGTLLDGVQFPDLVGYEAWLELERQEVARAWRMALLEQAHVHNQQHAHAQAEDLLRQAWRLDTTDEAVVQGLLRTLQAAQQPARAAQVLAEFRQHLKDIGAVPLESTVDLVQSQSSKPQHNLPQLTTRFVGRKHELAQVAAQLHNPECRLLCVVGLGGVGKTRFALEVVRQCLDEFPDGVWFVPLVGLESAQLLISALATAVGLQFSGTTRLETQLQNFLRHKKALLLLDNFEQLQAHSTLLEQLLFAAPDLKILLTSRVVVGLADEWLFDLTGLSYPPANTEQALEDFEAVQLFVGRVARRSGGIAETKTLPAIAQFCRQVQGLPLALELAAAWTRSLGVVEWLQRLESRLFSSELLKDSHQDPFLRQRNLNAILEYTFGLLSPSELAVLRRLSVFSGSFSLAAAETVAQAHLGHLLHLINLALLQRNLEGRFELHELVRQFAAKQLESAEKQAIVQQKNAFFIAFLVEQNKNLHSDISPETLVQGKLELGNIIEALEHGAMLDIHGGVLTDIQRGAVPDEAWHGFSSLIEVLGLFELGLQTVQQWLGSGVQAHLLALQAHFAVKLGEDHTAQSSAKACLALETSPIFHGIARYSLGIVAHFAGEFHNALLEYNQALEIFSASHNTSEMARVHNRIGVIYNNLDQPERAHQHYQTALELAQAANDFTEAGLIYNNHGIIFESLGETQKAKQFYTQALEICQRIGYLRGSSAALTNLGHLCEREGDYEAAKTHYEHSLTQKKIIGEPIPLAISQTNLADVLYQLGETSRANQINLQTLELTLNANALMYAARVVWSLCKSLVKQHQPHAVRLAQFLSQRHDSEQWVQNEAKDLLTRLGVAPQPSTLEFFALLEWFKNTDLLEL